MGPRTVLDTETKDIYMVTVTVTEADGNEVPKTVEIRVTDVNEAPMVITGATMVELSENYDVATAVATYTASDPENDTPVVTWTLQGADAGKFITFDPQNAGALLFKEALNYEMPADAGAKQRI